MDSTFQDRLISARTSKGWSQAELGEACGMAATQISRYESGRATPRALGMRKIADALGTSPEWLAHGEQSGIASAAALTMIASFSGGKATGTTGLNIELPSPLVAVLRDVAYANSRSLEEEIISRLERTVSTKPAIGGLSLFELIAMLDKLDRTIVIDGVKISAGLAKRTPIEEPKE